MQRIIFNSHTAKTFNNTHPSASHGSYVTTFFDLFIIIVKV